MIDHPEVGDEWAHRAAHGDVLAALIDEVVVGYLVAACGFYVQWVMGFGIGTHASARRSIIRPLTSPRRAPS